MKRATSFRAYQRFTMSRSRDSSQIPTYLISALTRRYVTVALSGDGGDELFCGYNRYFHALSIRPYLSTLPHWLRRTGSGLIRAVPEATWNRAQRLVPPRMRLPNIGDKLHKLANVMISGRRSDLSPATVTFSPTKRHCERWK